MKIAYALLGRSGLALAALLLAAAANAQSTRLVGKVTAVDPLRATLEIDGTPFEVRLGVRGSIPLDRIAPGEYVLVEQRGQVVHVLEKRHPNNVQ